MHFPLAYDPKIHHTLYTDHRSTQMYFKFLKYYFAPESFDVNMFIAKLCKSY